MTLKWLYLKNLLPGLECIHNNPARQACLVSFFRRGKRFRANTCLNSQHGKCKNPEVGACLVCSRSVKETRVTEVAQVEERWIERGDFIPRDQILRSLMGHYSSFDFYFVWHGKPWTAFECHFSHVWLFVTPWTVSFQATLSIGFSRQEYWNGLLASSPGDLPNPGTEPSSLLSPALAGEFFTTSGTSSIGYCLTN